MFVLMLVIGLLLLMARFARKFQISGGKLAPKPTAQIDMVSRRSLGKHMSLLVIRVANRTFLVGQSSQQVTLLAELGDDGSGDVASMRATPPNEVQLTPGTVLASEAHVAGAWDAFVDRLREMTVRR
ncbi:MAG: flagellar biosynthetic protein FliO [Acidimicrobiales bacterium]